MTEPRPRILIVDDVPSNIHALSGVLRGEHEIFFAADGQRGFDLACALLPDLILLDVMMPGEDGYAVCRRLKAEPSTADIPVIFITAMSEVDDEARGFEAGAVDFIPKPIRPLIVRARVGTHVRLKRQALRRVSLLDGLTGIANRRCLDETLASEWARGARAGRPLAGVMVDVDHFKAYNDHYGHGAGDDCLRATAAVLAAVAARSSDLVARYGGEEFACLLPETDEAGAAAFAGRLMEAVASLALPHAASPVAPRVTVSIGYAALVPRASVSAGTLFAEADAWLYKAKRGGRNRVLGPRSPALCGAA